MTPADDVNLLRNFEDIVFHRTASGRVFRRFKGSVGERGTVHSNRRFTDAHMGARIAIREGYERH